MIPLGFSNVYRKIACGPLPRQTLPSIPPSPLPSSAPVRSSSQSLEQSVQQLWLIRLHAGARAQAWEKMMPMSGTLGPVAPPVEERRGAECGEVETLSRAPGLHYDWDTTFSHASSLVITHLSFRKRAQGREGGRQAGRKKMWDFMNKSTGVNSSPAAKTARPLHIWNG